MRARAAANFTLADLAEIMRIVHDAQIKAYLVVNTLLFDHDITIMKKLVDAGKKHQVDAIIAFDFATIQYCNQIAIPVHVSVQFSVSNYESLKFFAQFTNRVVLARELTIPQIKAIHEKIIAEQLMGREGHLMEIEAFIHGALCIAQSGRCQMSLYTNNASANRGACLQNCRAKYKVTDMDTGKELVIDNHYVMSAADICTIDFLDELLDAGVQVMKIEGRGRAPEYVATVVTAYKQALQDIATGSYTHEKILDYYRSLETVYNRGLSKGNYYLGKELGDYCDQHGSKATTEKLQIGRVTHYYPKTQIAEIVIESEQLRVGDTMLIIGATTGVMELVIPELYHEG
jgi:putative protease